MSNAKEQRQGEYLRIVSGTGSLVQARRRIGVTSKTVADWRRDPNFAEAVQDALDVANDAIRAKVREMALAGSEPMLALSMKVIEPALQPKGSQVAVGVKVNAGHSVESRRAARAAAMSDEELVAKINRIVGDARMRIEAGKKLQGQIVDVQAITVAVEPSEPGGGPDAGLSVEDPPLDGDELIDPENLL